MSAISFAGRSTVNRLHRTVQRNISRQHAQARFESSKPNTTPSRNVSTVASEASKQRLIPEWAEPLMAPFLAYGRMQHRSPLLTQLSTTSTIFFLGDLSSQAVASEGFTKKDYQPSRGLRALAIGATVAIPSYKWFNFLGRNFNYASKFRSILTKVLINQLVYTPLFNSYFFGLQSLLSGSTRQEAKERVVRTVPVSWANSWKVWPAVMSFNFMYIPMQYRSVFAGVIAVGWQTYLSWLNLKFEGVEEKKTAARSNAAAVSKFGKHTHS